MLIYSLLHLSGYAHPTMEEISNFRQLGSPCAGHPENFLLDGVEATTGPLGQGLAMAVGMAIAERHLNAEFGSDLVDHRTWVVAGDGCLMEGVNHEAIGLAGHLGLGRLIVLWDDNHITIDGSTELSTSEDIEARYRAAGWHTVRCDGHDYADIQRAIDEAWPTAVPRWSPARRSSARARPTSRAQRHPRRGARRGRSRRRARDAGLEIRRRSKCPRRYSADWRETGERGAEARASGKGAWPSPTQGRELTRRMAGDLPKGFSLSDYIAKLYADPKNVATRKASEMALEVINGMVPETVGGSADLTGSNNTKTSQTHR